MKNLESQNSLKNRKLCPEYSHHSRFTHAPELIPFKVAGSTSAGAAIIRLDRPSGANVLDETDNYRTISNDYDTEQHRRVERRGFMRILRLKSGLPTTNTNFRSLYQNLITDREITSQQTIPKMIILNHSNRQRLY